MARVQLLGIPLLAVLVLGLPMGLRPAAAQTKETEARGTVTAVTDSSLTVKVGEKEMKFGVDNKTLVGARGAGRATRDAQTQGAAGIKLTSVVKTGGAVLVMYRETNGALLATEVRTISDAGPAGGSTQAPTKIASGRVKSVTASSLVVTADAKDLTFVVDAKTLVVARGAGTATRGAGGAISITSLVGTGDTVSVTYEETGQTMRAAEVRITVKAR